MSTDERYNGWTNRETWAVALHINNDQGWQESVLEQLRNALRGRKDEPGWARHLVAGDVIRENVEETLRPIEDAEIRTGMFDRKIDGAFHTTAQWLALQDIGSLWRVSWTELGRSFLEDLADQS